MKDMMMCSVGETWWALHKWPLVTWLSHRMMVNKLISITQHIHIKSQHALPTWTNTVKLVKDLMST